MDSNLQDSQTPDSKSQSIIPFTSISLSIPKFLIRTHFKSPPKIQSFSLKFPSKTLKIPSSLNLSVNPFHQSSKSSQKSKISSNPFQIQLPSNPTRRNDPPATAGIRRVSVVWFRSDLRIQDNESLNSANNESLSVLPVYCFDSNLFGKFSSGFGKIGQNEASFLIESVSDLRNSLRAKGSDLIVRIGKPESVLSELVKQVGAESVYVHREVNNEEVKNERKIENVLKDEGVEVKYFWGSTLFHIDDLPFKLDKMPSGYSEFREKLKGVKVRKTIEVVDQMKGLPSCGNVEAGEIPSLGDLGFNPASNMTPVKSVSNGSLIGGETEALNRIKRFAAECQTQSPKESNDTIYGASFSCKVSPWLALGCLSPRSVFDELKKSASRTVSAASNGNDGDSGMNWLMYELLWRDFFRFVTRKCSSSKQHNTAPVTAGATV